MKGPSPNSFARQTRKGEFGDHVDTSRLPTAMVDETTVPLGKGQLPLRNLVSLSNFTALTLTREQCRAAEFDRSEKNEHVKLSMSTLAFRTERIFGSMSTHR